MVYKIPIKLSNFSFDEMPVENIVYSRKGGCFVTLCKGALLTILLIIAGCLLGTIVYYSTKYFYNKIDEETLQEYLMDLSDLDDKKHSKSLVIPKNYHLVIYPIFNETEKPFSFHGSVLITVTPLENTSEIELDADDLNIESICVYRSKTLTENQFQNFHNEKKVQFKRDVDDVTENYNFTYEINTEIDETHLATTFNYENHILNMMNVSDSILDESYFIFSDKLNENDVMEMTVSKIDRKNDKILIKLCLEMRAGNYYFIKIKYNGKMTNDRGLVYSSSADEDLNLRYFAGTITKPYGITSIFPCFGSHTDELTTFDLSIIRHYDTNSVSNTRINITELLDNNLMIDHFQTSLPMTIESFGFALTSARPQIIEINSEVSLKVYATFEITANIRYKDSDISRIFIEFENITGRKYPENDVYVVGVPNTLENIVEVKRGLILISESKLSKVDHYIEVSHEMARLFTLSLTTFSENTNRWIDEILPITLQIAALNNVFNVPDLASELIAAQIFKSKYIEMNLLDNSVSPITDNNSILIKGYFLLEIIRELITIPIYQAGFRDYYKGLDKEDNDFFDHLKKSASNNLCVASILNELIETWTKLPYFPILSISENSTTIQIRQDSYKPDEKEIDKLSNWIIPIQIYESEGKLQNSTIWMCEHLVVVPIKQDSWFLINSTVEPGYFRVNYNVENWIRLIEALGGQARLLFSPITRATLADDILNLALYGHQDYALAFDLIYTWKMNETDYLPWKLVLDNLEMLYKNIDILDHINLKKFIINLILPIYNDERNSEKLNNLINRWACIELSLPICINSCREKFENIISNSIHLPPSTETLEELEIIFGTIIKYGTQHEWNIIADSLSNVHNFEYKQILIRTLGYSRDPSNLNVYFEFLKVDAFKRFIPDIMLSISRNKIAKLLIFEYFLNNFDELSVEMHDYAVLFRSISTELEYRWFNQIFIQHSRRFKTFGKDKLRGVASVIEQTLQWKRNFSNRIRNVDWSKYL